MFHRGAFFVPVPIGKASRRETGQAEETCVLWKAGASFHTSSRYMLIYLLSFLLAACCEVLYCWGGSESVHWRDDGCGSHEVQNSAFPRGMRHQPEEPGGTPRAVCNALRSEGREKIMPSVSVRAYFGESRRCGFGVSFCMDSFPRALIFFGARSFGSEGADRKRCKPRRTCCYFMKHQPVCFPEH